MASRYLVCGHATETKETNNLNESNMVKNPNWGRQTSQLSVSFKTVSQLLNSKNIYYTSLKLT